MTESVSKWTTSSAQTLCQAATLPADIPSASATPTTSPTLTELAPSSTKRAKPRKLSDALTRPARLDRRRSSQQSALYGIKPERWAHFPRLSTVLDDSTMASAHARFDSLQFSNDELLETSSTAYSSDEESIVAGRLSTKDDKAHSKNACASPKNSGSKLQRAVSSSSARAASSLRRMGSTLRRAPSTLLSKPKSSISNRTLDMPEPILQCLKTQQNNPDKPKKRRASLADTFSRVFLPGKENRSASQAV